MIRHSREEELIREKGYFRVREARGGLEPAQHSLSIPGGRRGFSVGGSCSALEAQRCAVEATIYSSKL